MKQVTIYTDGSSRGNPGPGGFGTLLIYGERRKELSGGFEETTNNRMELLAAIVGLETLKEACEVRLHSDSRYVVDAMTKGWIEGWKKRGWRRKTEALKNADLWQRLDQAAYRHKIDWIWVKGHAGNECNEICDQLAVNAAMSDKREVDKGYLPEV